MSLMSLMSTPMQREADAVASRCHARPKGCPRLHKAEMGPNNSFDTARGAIREGRMSAQQRAMSATKKAAKTAGAAGKGTAAAPDAGASMPMGELAATASGALVNLRYEARSREWTCVKLCAI